LFGNSNISIFTEVTCTASNNAPYFNNILTSYGGGSYWQFSEDSAGTGGGEPGFYFDYGGAGAFHADATPINVPGTNLIAMGIGNGTESAVANGGTVVTASGPFVSGNNLAYIGRNRISDEFFNGYIQRICVWNTRLPDATLQALTAGTISPESVPGLQYDLNFATGSYLFTGYTVGEAAVGNAVYDYTGTKSGAWSYYDPPPSRALGPCVGQTVVFNSTLGIQPGWIIGVNADGTVNLQTWSLSGSGNPTEVPFDQTQTVVNSWCYPDPAVN
jgi:hypothetical protein